MSEEQEKSGIWSYWNGFIEKSREKQISLDERFKRLGKAKYGRILKMARKPDYEEYVKTSGISALGIIIIGAIGFAVYYFYKYIPEWVSSL
jgi:protein transport protein SEC61 subunit gamma and related proteins